MKFPFLTLLAALLAGVGTAHALPPAPFYTLYGTVRDAVGQIVEVPGARILLLKGGAEIGSTPIDSSLQPSQNYELRVRLDHARPTTRLYSPEAVVTEGAFSVRVEMNGQVFLPIQSSGNLTAGKGGERVRYDITIGVDSDGDGLPDAWEEWQLYQAGYPPLPSGGWDISLITPNGDLDGDGSSNLSEYLAGTYAADPTSYIELQIKEKGVNFARLEFFRVTGKTYRLQRTNDLAPGSWTPVDFALTKGGVPAGFHRALNVGPLPIFVVPLAEKEFYRLTVQGKSSPRSSPSRLGLTMVVGGDKEQVEALSADGKQRQLTTFLFIQSQPLDVVKKAVKLAREDRQAFEDEYLLPFELELPVTAMFTAMQQLENNLSAIEAAQIEAVTRPAGSKKEPTPPPN